MESVKINRNSIVYEFSEITTELIREEDGRLLIVFRDKVYPKIVEGAELSFYRDIYIEDGVRKDLVNKVSVLETLEYEIDGTKHEAVYTTIPSYGSFTLPESCVGINIKAASTDCSVAGDGYIAPDGGYLVVRTDSGFTVEKAIDYHPAEEPFFIIEFAEEHNITQQDIEVLAASGAGDFSMTVLDIYGEKIGEIGGISIPLKNSPRTINSADTLTYADEETCGMEKDYRIYKYTYLKDTFGKNRIKFTTATVPGIDLFKSAAEYLLTNGKFFVPRFNRIYFFKMENLSEKNCILWTDPWWPICSGLNSNRGSTMTVYENTGGNSRSYFGEYAAYWNVPSLYFASENLSLGNEDEIKNSYVDDVIERAVPDVIDMERLKYKPVIFDEEGLYSFVKSITLDFHFLKRKMKSDAYFEYEDGWYVDKDEESTTWWNGMSYTGDTFNSSAMTNFVTTNGAKSDLLGYLGFTDDDVRYRKLKLTKSFVRLSFYSSPDPIEQKLLYYSTIFLDGTSLYGKFIKQSTLKSDRTRGTGNFTPIVWYDNNSLSARLDTEIVLRDEYNTEHSSEGFNLYLFADDAMGVNNARTIYMKVEFNHAGNGKVIPMALWPVANESESGDTQTYQSPSPSRLLGFENVLDEPESTLLVANIATAVSPRVEQPCEIRPDLLTAGATIITDIGCLSDSTPTGCTSNTCTTDGCPTDTMSGLPCRWTEDELITTDTLEPICFCKTDTGGGIIIDEVPEVTATTIYGYVYDSIYSDPIEGVNIVIKRNSPTDIIVSGETQVTGTTNENGHFSITLPLYLYNDSTTKFSKFGYVIKEYADTTMLTSQIYLTPSSPGPCLIRDGGGEEECVGDSGGEDTGSTRVRRYLPMKIDNYLENLYIPIEIKYLNERDFVYSISGATVEGENLRLMLFEPKIDYKKSDDE